MEEPRGRHSQPGEQRTRCVSKHKWRDQGQALTGWRAEDVVCQRRRVEGPRAGTHALESRGRGVSAGAKQRDRGQALTGWRAEDAVGQQTQNGGTEGRHSLPGQQRMRCVSRHSMEGPRAGTHKLESRGCCVSAGAKQRDQGQALTHWRADVLWVVSDEVQWRRWGRFTCLPCKYPASRAFWYLHGVS
jgi:hypothetical protein